MYMYILKVKHKINYFITMTLYICTCICILLNGCPSFIYTCISCCLSLLKVSADSEHDWNRGTRNIA